MPNDSVILEHLALAYEKTGEIDKARNTAKRALEYSDSSEDEDIKPRLEELYRRLGGDLVEGL